MTIYTILDLLARFGRVEGPDRSGNYKCHCPAHNDKQSSLSVKDGDRGVVLKCHANCPTDRICSALGIELKDLMHEDAPKKERQSGSLKPWERIEKQYAYTDESGNVLYWNVRLHSPKDFRQTMPDPNNPGRMVWHLDKGLRKVLYRLPDIRREIDNGRSVFIVEGEKDADSLFRIGYAGTTNAAGGGQKWEDDYCRQLRGARRIFIMGDNDRTGYQHMLDVWDAINYARQTDDSLPVPEMVMLLKVWRDMPRKADISDLLAAFGDEEGERMMRAAIEKGASRQEIREAINAMSEDGQKGGKPEKPADPPQMSALIADDTEQGRAYMDVNGYAVVNGCLCGMNADGGIKQLTTFSAIPRKMVIRDDGENVSTMYEIEGWNRDGAKLGTATVKASEFNGMGWVAENWGFEANILPGNTIKDRVRYAMVEAGRKTAARGTVYTHTGWRQLGGRLCFLSGGGAVGADNVSVQLEGKLGAYDMSIDNGMSAGEACSASLMIFSVMSAHVAYPIMAMAYLAPLVSFMEKKGCAPRFGLWLLGATQSGKTTAALLGLSHFGNFNAQDKIPASFTDTANSVQRSAFLLKDMPILVDDYFPVSNAQERRKMEAMAQSLSRSVGNGASRGRLNSDMQQRTGYRPRGVTLFTGEDVPDIKESGLARFFLVNVKRGDVYMDEGLTQLQEMAAEGMLTTAMRGYVEWLALQADTLPDRLHEMFKEYRTLCRSGMGAAGARACEALACLTTATTMMLEYWAHKGAIDSRTKDDMLRESVRINCETARQQAREIREQKPTSQFLEILRELLSSGANKCLDVTETNLSINVIGWQDTTYYYLMPEIAYKAVSKFCADQGTAFPITLAMLRKQFVEEKIITEEYTNRVKKIRGRTARYIWIPREIIDGKETKAEQMTMKEAADEDMPF